MLAANAVAQRIEPSLIAFNENGLYSGNISSDEPKESCKDFVLTEKDVSEFLASASVIAERVYSHDLNASNCYSKGTLTDSKGNPMKWQIDRARRGFFLDAAGKPTFYYCNDCSSKAYYEPCDLTCVHEK